MATVDVADDGVTVRLWGWESLATMRREVHLPFSALVAANATHQWIRGLVEIRMPGVVVPGRTKVGVFTTFDGTRRLLAMHHGDPILRLACHPGRATGFGEVLVSTPDAHALAHLLTARLPR